MSVRHCVFVLGPAGSAKTELWKTLAEAQTEMQTGGGATRVQALNPKAVTSNDLYGYVHPVSKEPYDGIVAKMMREFSRDTKPNPKWIVLDGDIDAEWIESMNTVMDDNKVLTLVSNERIPLNASMRLVFEISHLRNASPATVSRAGVLFLNESGQSLTPPSLSDLVSHTEFPQIPPRYHPDTTQIPPRHHPDTIQFVFSISTQNLHEQTLVGARTFRAGSSASRGAPRPRGRREPRRVYSRVSLTRLSPPRSSTLARSAGGTRRPSRSSRAFSWCAPCSRRSSPPRTAHPAQTRRCTRPTSSSQPSGPWEARTAPIREPTSARALTPTGAPSSARGRQSNGPRRAPSSTTLSPPAARWCLPVEDAPRQSSRAAAYATGAR